MAITSESSHSTKKKLAHHTYDYHFFFGDTSIHPAIFQTMEESSEELQIKLADVA